MRWGNDEQRREFLPRLASGEWLGGLRPERGARRVRPGQPCAPAPCARAIPTSSTAPRPGSPAASSADVFILFAVTDETVKPSRGISAFIVPQRHARPERRAAKRTRWASAPAPPTRFIFEDARVPGPLPAGQEGEGFKIAMSLLDGGRIGIAAQGLGIAEGAYEAAAQLRPAARAVRPAHRRLPGHPVHAGRHGDRHRRRATAALSRRHAQGPAGSA